MRKLATLKTFFLTVLVTFGIHSTAVANPFPYGGGEQQAASVFKRGIDSLTNYLANGPINNQGPLEVFLEREIVPFFDFQYMTRWVAGQQFRFMNPQQKQAMQAKLKRLFFAAMIDKLSDYRHGHVRFLRPSGNPQTGIMTLRLMAYQQGTPFPQRLSFRMYRSPAGWKVFDVASNGQSVVAFYRTQFALEAQQRQQPRFPGYSGYRGNYPNYPRY